MRVENRASDEAMHFSSAAATAAIVLSVAGAQAADGASKRERPPAFAWAGFHIGVTAGAGFPVASGGRLEAGGGFTSNAFDLLAPNRDSAGPTVGARVGYDWQVDQWVYGFETDFNFLGVRRSSTGLFPAPASYVPSAVGYALTADENGNYFASVRGRLGFAVDRSLFYLTGGVAAGGWRGASTLGFVGPAPLGPFHAPVSQSSRMKYALGAGWEYALYDQWSARLEYLYLNQALQTRVFDDGRSTQFGARQRSEAHVFRLGLSYRFGDEQETRGKADSVQAAVIGEDDKREKEQGGAAEDIGDRLHLTGAGRAASGSAKPDGREGAKADEKGKKKQDEKKRAKKVGESKNEDRHFEPVAERYSVHGQTTNILQGYPKFPALYTGPKSFTPSGQARFGSTTNLFLGLRLWEGAGVFLNPEIDAGYGLSDSSGAASFVNSAVAKVGRAEPYMRFQRYFLRQIVGLGGGRADDPDTGSFSETLESTQNQLAGKVDRDRLILTIGKFAVGDVFDDNVYAHDPTTGFLNFAFNTMGSFDYAADAWGYTHGVALEWKQDWWTARGGLFQLSQIPDGPAIEPVLGRQFMGVAEFEARYDLFGQPGVLKFLAYGDNGYIAKMGDVVDFSFLTGNFPPDVANDALRKRRVKLGGHINLQQQIAPDLGFFLRAGMSDGRFETIDYTDIDRQVSFGFVASGKLWGRPRDEIGGAMAFSGLSGPRVRYFALGGASAYIGDGRLSYGGEKAMEAYYKYNLSEGVDLTFDYQLVGNPAHNLDRGPVNVFALRAHAQF
jgi:high affinity Mn2+ porin